MSYYKNSHLIITWHNNVVEEFIKGVRLYKESGNVIKRERLGPGCTKYNIEIMRKLKDIQRDYLYTISIEASVIYFVKNYTDRQRIMTRNIWRLVTAQKKTINFINVFIHALKQYAVKDQDVYACINKWIGSLQERVERNLKFTEEHMKQFGLLPLVDAIKEEYGITIYEYVDRLNSDFCSQTKLEKSDENFYEERDLFICRNFISLSERHKIDICSLVKEAEKSAMDRIKKDKEKADASKAAQKKMDKQKIAYRLNTEDNNQIYHSIENADDRIQECMLLIQALRMNGGKIWYLTAVKSSRLFYITSDAKRTLRIDRAALFSAENSDEMKSIMLEYSGKNPADIISVQHINLPGNLPGGYEKIKGSMRVMDLVNIELEERKRMLYMTLTDSWDINQTQCCRMEYELMKNNGNIYGICLIKKKPYSVESCFIPESWQKDKGFEAPAFTQSASKTRWYCTEDEAQKTISEIKNDMPGNMSAHIMHLEYHGPYNLHDYIMDKLINKTMKSVASVMKNKDENKVCKYFDTFSDFERFRDSINISPACVIVNNDCMGQYPTRYVSDGRIYGSLLDIMRPRIKDPVMVDPDDADGMEKLKDLCRQQHEEFGRRQIYCIVKFWKDEGLYKACVEYMPWEEPGIEVTVKECYEFGPVLTELKLRWEGKLL